MQRQNKCFHSQVCQTQNNPMKIFYSLAGSVIIVNSVGRNVVAHVRLVSLVTLHIVETFSRLFLVVGFDVFCFLLVLKQILSDIPSQLITLLEIFGWQKTGSFWNVRAIVPYLLLLCSPPAAEFALAMVSQFWMPTFPCRERVDCYLFVAPSLEDCLTRLTGSSTEYRFRLKQQQFHEIFCKKNTWLYRKRRVLFGLSDL